MSNYTWDRKSDRVAKEDDVLAWARWFESADRVLRQDRPAEGVLVSTVFLGVDHDFLGDGPPVLWETMAFCPSLPGLDEFQDRYATRAEAEAGHAAALAAARAALARATNS